MLSARTNVSNEILATEKLLLQQGVLPALFFRFPGLVANKELLKTVNELGLIPLGSNAWLAKHEKPVNGSILLVHGNGNEPKGIDVISKLLTENRQRSIAWLPLQQALE